MKQIHNTNVNPVVALLLNIFVLVGLGDIMIGQTNKGVMKLLCSLFGLCLCCFPGLIIVILSHIDLYLCASALQRGETIGENEYRQELLFKLIKMIDKTATYVG